METARATDHTDQKVSKGISLWIIRVLHQQMLFCLLFTQHFPVE